MLTSRTSRLKYNFSVDFFRPDGHVIFSDLAAARAFAAQMSARRTDPISATDLYALSLLDEAYHILLKHFYDRYTGVMGRAMGMLQSNLGSKYDLTLSKFTEEFPPMSIYRGETTAGVYLSTKAPHFGDFGRGVRAVAIEEMLLVNNSNNNPALNRYKDLIDESVMKGSAYKELVQFLLTFFSRQPGFGNGESALGETLSDILIAPIKASPDSLEGQLRYIIEKWGYLLGETFSVRVLRGLDFLREDAIRIGHAHIDSQNIEKHVPTFGGNEYAEYERYSVDKDWMPRLVLLAKNTYVWLSQLSRKYQCDITTLDQIPDEELDLLASRGFTGLWLIGLWERSRASQKIKQRMGQEDAVASAYSLHSYDIANDLGDWNALNNLRSRAWARGIRLSADMVPNHMGIDSTWVVEHPEWFLSSSFPPYPSYSFKSENLSDDLRVGIYLEDHYYNKTDAAVVFQRRDLKTGDMRYIYHGNDGTSFPWNDTAQLDYTNPTVREAVIQVILHVARNFPIIRFDAAMTLAKKHIQRLWFPEPGAGGAIPSRSQYGMSKFEFDEKIPEEFWREVVDRVAKEVPDTLLLAEAFWLMEGYFVRTLGMHRVYNSAFMHMLRDEDNAKYRLAIKNTLEFDPQILKRYVNFMNNPDEKTAIEQFGNGDKYFGICTVLSTLPGLPMFGHGQVEGFSEKYGMEFRRAKWEETPDDGLIRGHEWRIFPLLHRRYLFADVEQFLLFDFYTSNGSVDEQVFAYSNRFNDPSEHSVSGRDERGLIVYHNKFADTRGWIKTSAAYINKASGKTIRRSLAQGLGLPHVGHVIFKDYVTQLEYIRSCKEIWDKGMYFELGAYQCHAFMDWRFVGDVEWQAICNQLNGAGVQSMQDEWTKFFSAIEETKVKIEAPKKKRAVRKVAAKAKKVQPKAKKLVLAPPVQEKKVTPVKAEVVTKPAETPTPMQKKVQPKAKKPVVTSPVQEKKVTPVKAEVVTKPAETPTPKQKKVQPKAKKPVVTPLVQEKKAVVVKTEAVVKPAETPSPKQKKVQPKAKKPVIAPPVQEKKAVVVKKPAETPSPKQKKVQPKAAKKPVVTPPMQEKKVAPVKAETVVKPVETLSPKQKKIQPKAKKPIVTSPMQEKKVVPVKAEAVVTPVATPSPKQKKVQPKAKKSVVTPPVQEKKAAPVKAEAVVKPVVTSPVQEKKVVPVKAEAVVKPVETPSPKQKKVQPKAKTPVVTPPVQEKKAVPAKAEVVIKTAETPSPKRKKVQSKAKKLVVAPPVQEKKAAPVKAEAVVKPVETPSPKQKKVQPKAKKPVVMPPVQEAKKSVVTLPVQEKKVVSAKAEPVVRPVAIPSPKRKKPGKKKAASLLKKPK